MGARGEGTIQLEGGGEVRVLFTNRALAEAERMTGQTVLQLVAAVQRVDIGMVPLNMLLKAGMTAARAEQGGGKPATPEEAFDVLDKAGFLPVLKVVSTALVDVINWEPAEAASPFGESHGGSTGTSS